eukprot:TRINITY_DN16933_c0_g1_i3.p1 TRINITY_DN16933_c0_g1~~TRINITY_DN16933_c0_g1_i3.p1  ORF type:complete len:376 (+),score=77.77 TRINITY_DN16933_c0_g1_i3:249-1376(+)
MKNQLNCMMNSKNQAQNNQQNHNNQNQANNNNNSGKQPSDDKEKPQSIEEKESKKFSDALSQAIITEKPNVKWEDVAGLENAKKALQEAVILPIKFPDIFDTVRKPWKGILLYGPPGTGKTFLAKACATECNATFFSVSSSDLVSKWVGESAKLIRALFEMARKNKPSVIFIDEIDSLCGSRDSGQNDASKSVVTEFLVQMQGVGKDDKGLLVLGATNLPWSLDSAIRRRFEKRIFINLPEKEARSQLLQISLKKTQHELTIENMDEIAKETEGYSGADLTNLIKDAAYQPLRIAQEACKFKQVMDGGKMKYQATYPSDNEGVFMKFTEIQPSMLSLPKLTMDNFYNSLNNVKKSVSNKDISQHVKWTQEFGQDG